jgi:uncharacterized membrane protein YfcA
MPTYAEATTLSGLLALTTSLIITIKMWRCIEWKKLLPILCVFLIASFIGVQLIDLANDSLLKKSLGVVLILTGIYFLLASNKIKLRPTIFTQTTMGTLSGLLGGTCGMQGPPAVLYFISAAKHKDNYIALTQAYFLLGNIAMTAFRASNGYLTAEVAKCWAFGIVAVAIGTAIGHKVFSRISTHTLRTIVYIYLIASGTLMLFL